MNSFVAALLDALKDTAFVIPVLYLAYLLVGFFSHNNGKKYSKILHHTKKAGPLVGAFLGCVPQCGFSSVMAKLYSSKIVTLGTMFAVFIATSDEAIPLMIAEPKFIPKLLLLLLIKLIFAIIIGYGIDLVLKLFVKKQQKTLSKTEQGKVENLEASTEQVEATSEVHHEHCEHAHEHDTEHECEHKHEENEFMDCGCNHKHTHSDCCAKNIFLDALKHTAIIVAYVFIATLAINLCVEYLGLEAIQNLFTQNMYIQILIASIVGLIPNCSASVLLVELYMSGVIYFAPMVAGLCAGAGVGLIVLFTTNRKHIWQNLLIILILFVFAFVCGTITSFIPIF